MHRSRLPHRLRLVQLPEDRQGLRHPPARGLPECLQAGRADLHPHHQGRTGHDEAISFEELSAQIGSKLADALRNASIALYNQAAEYALQRGIIIADTKFEFGTDENGDLILADEVLTPDSSRFWPVDSYQVGKNPPSLDKQFVRDWLDSVHFNHQPPAPELPPEVVQKTREKYEEALESLKVRG